MQWWERWLDGLVGGWMMDKSVGGREGFSDGKLEGWDNETLEARGKEKQFGGET